jgi:hypothetical protein
MAEHRLLRTMARHHLYIFEPRLVALESAHADTLCGILCSMRLDDMGSRVGCVAGPSAAVSVGREVDVVTFGSVPSAVIPSYPSFQPFPCLVADPSCNIIIL